MGLRKIVLNSVLLLVAALALVPLVMMWLAALRPAAESLVNPIGLPSRLDFGNLVEAWRVGRMGLYFKNSLLVIIPRVGGVLVLASLAGFAFAKLPFPCKTPLLVLFLFGMTLPIQALIIPLFYQMKNLGLINTYASLFLPAYGFSMPFGIFLMRSFFRSLPDELLESARIDGAGEYLIFARIVVPLAMPGMLSLLVFEFMWGWNDFLIPLLMIWKESMRTLPLGVIYFSNKYTVNPTLVAAGVTIVSFPIVLVYLLFQRGFERGLTAGAIK